MVWGWEDHSYSRKTKRQGGVSCIHMRYLLHRQSGSCLYVIPCDSHGPHAILMDSKGLICSILMSCSVSSRKLKKTDGSLRCTLNASKRILSCVKQDKEIWDSVLKSKQGGILESRLLSDSIRHCFHSKIKDRTQQDGWLIPPPHLAPLSIKMFSFSFSFWWESSQSYLLSSLHAGTHWHYLESRELSGREDMK